LLINYLTEYAKPFAPLSLQLRFRVIAACTDLKTTPDGRFRKSNHSFISVTQLNSSLVRRSLFLLLLWLPSSIKHQTFAGLFRTQNEKR